jgi:glycosyltransferase involved in cell wall biosynthesis
MTDVQVDSEADRLRVLFVHTATLPPLGADTWVHVQIITALDRSTHDVYAACATHGSAENGATDTPTYAALKGIDDLGIIPVNFGPELSGRSRTRKVRALVQTLPAVVSLVRLAWFIRRKRISIIHTSDRPRDAFASVLLARLTGAKCIVHVHVAYNPTWMGAMLRWSIGRADALVAISEFVAATLATCGQPPSSIHVVPNAIDVNRWSPGVGRHDGRAELGVSASTVVVITICRLFPEKGPGELIRAFAVVRSGHPDVQLLVVGQEMEAGYLSELQHLASRLGVDDIVRFLGRRSDIERLLAASDVYAMPSTEEPFGLVFLEAMAMKLPVVALDNGGTPEVVDHPTTGLLSEPGDTDTFAQNLAALVDDPLRRAELGSAGRRVVEQRFTTTRMADDMAATYRLVASPSRAEVR